MTIPSGLELILILAIILLIFGGAKLPGLARSMGSSIREFRKGAELEESKPSEDAKESAEADSTTAKT